MADPLTFSDLKLTGRVNSAAQKVQPASINYDADFSAAADVTLDFKTVNQAGVFGVAKTLFMDNGSNPEPVEVSISGTNYFFTVPAFAQGYFHLEAAENSDIRFVTVGGATDKVTTTVYNWDVPPSVWYSFGTFNNLKPIMGQGTMEEGDTVAAETFNRPLFIGGIDRATGDFRGVGVDALGRLDFSSTINIGGVFGADPMGGAPVNPGFPLAVLNSAGNLVYLQLDAAGDLQVADTLALAQLVAANASLDAIEADVTEATTGTPTSVAASIAVGGVELLAAGAGKGFRVYNDSTAILYLLEANAVPSLTNYTVQVPAGGFFADDRYNGRVMGIWAAANGAARITRVA